MLISDVVLGKMDLLHTRTDEICYYSIILDVLLYMTTRYRQEMINSVTDELNRHANADRKLSIFLFLTFPSKLQNISPLQR